jgi:YggT family protein
VSDLAYVLIRATNLFANSLLLVILARVVLSWVYPNLRNTLVFWIWRISEPILQPLRRVLPSTGSLDLTPWLAMVLIFFGRALIIRFLYTWF